ncbi:hypothetical protein P0E20_003518 [Vibrio harveyi]|uniref:hypothetical protein n=1 Tax=Vibrio harveyi TaxID=669 RepID=UPI0009386677|nr:hypothetical protein [Vibrio harveyi]APP08145.1 hypothetical protein BG259_23090 [Vibrio harveyi]EKO3869538.1 hypothetical protein [Vibrio harveyi]
MEFKLSPNYTYEKLESNDIEDFIDVFEDRMLNWIFKPVEMLLNLEEGYIAAMGILSTYFEGIQIYIKGKDSTRNSQAFFIDGFCEVFGTSEEALKPKVKDTAKAFYSQSRCGFAHDGLFKNKLFFSNAYHKTFVFTYPMTEGELDTSKPVESIVVNPYRFAELVFEHYKNYIGVLRDNKNVQIRSNFEQAVKIKWGLDEGEAIIAMSQDEFCTR